MNENLWSILAEFTYPHTPESFEQASSVMKEAVERLCLPETFLQRLNVALKETMTNLTRRPDEEQTVSPALIRILSNWIVSPTQVPSSSWGFFFIEKGQLIELYLYQDQA